MENNLNLPNLEGMMMQMSQDHFRLDAELDAVKRERQQKEEELQAINKEIELHGREKTSIVQLIQKEKFVTDELIDREVKLREEIFGTDTNFKRSKLYEVSRSKSQLNQLKMKKEHNYQRINRLDEDEKEHRQLWDKFEQSLPLMHGQKEVKYEVVCLETKLEELCANRNMDQLQQEVDHLKETISLQNLENDRNQEEAVNKKKERKLLEQKKQQLTLEIRSLENRIAAKKKRLSSTIQDLEAKLYIDIDV